MRERQGRQKKGNERAKESNEGAKKNWKNGQSVEFEILISRYIERKRCCNHISTKSFSFMNDLRKHEKLFNSFHLSSFISRTNIPAYYFTKFWSLNLYCNNTRSFDKAYSCNVLSLATLVWCRTFREKFFIFFRTFSQKFEVLIFLRY